jgi:hypothetical protein
MSDPSAITDEDLARSRADPRFKQQLLSKSLENLLESMHRLQNSARGAQPAGARQLREGAVMAAHVSDLIRKIDEKLQIESEPP